MEAVNIVYAKRTAIGKFLGGLSNLSAPDLGAQLVKNAVETLPQSKERIEAIYMGQVLTAGTGQAPARQAALNGGLPNSVSATTINKVCGSGMEAIIQGVQSLQLQQAKMVLAGGQEAMSQAPHMLPQSRSGIKYGSAQFLDHLQHDGLTDPYSGALMGTCGDSSARELDISRQAQDEFAMSSYSRARNAWEQGISQREIVPVQVKTRKATLEVKQDEEPFSSDLEKLPKLRAAFDKEGTITAGNASSLNDGAALLGLATQGACLEFGYKPLARIVAYCGYAAAPAQFPTAPVGGIEKLLKQTGLSVEDIDLFEVNEAFAVVSLAAMQKLSIPTEKMNVFGGAVALGHPIGASGARIVVTLLNGLQETGGKRGIASICIGGGESLSLLIERLD